MIYQLNISVVALSGIIKQDFLFEHYENGYAMTSRRTNEILQHNPQLHIGMDKEQRDFNHGTYQRAIKLVDSKSMEKGTLILTGKYFDDALVEQFPEHFEQTDFPNHKTEKQ